MSNQLHIELATERMICRSKMLPAFHRNGTSWEFLLLLAAKGGVSEEGIANTLQLLETSYLGPSAMSKFVSERRAEGSVTFLEHEKRSKWRLSLAPDALDELTAILNWRRQQLRDDGASAERNPL